jgi:hypothetical protein
MSYITGPLGNSDGPQNWSNATMNYTSSPTLPLYLLIGLYRTDQTSGVMKANVSIRLRFYVEHTDRKLI